MSGTRREKFSRSLRAPLVPYLNAGHGPLHLQPFLLSLRVATNLNAVVSHGLRIVFRGAVDSALIRMKQPVTVTGLPLFHPGKFTPGAALPIDLFVSFYSYHFPP